MGLCVCVVMVSEGLCSRQEPVHYYFTCPRFPPFLPVIYDMTLKETNSHLCICLLVFVQEIT